VGGARLASVVALVLVAVTFTASSAADGRRAVTGRFAYEDEFVVSPGIARVARFQSTATCSGSPPSRCCLMPRASRGS
jgi:hypothetical protein